MFRTRTSDWFLHFEVPSRELTHPTNAGSSSSILWTGYVSSHGGIYSNIIYQPILRGTICGFLVQLRNFRHEPEDSQGHPHLDWLCVIALQILMELMHSTFGIFPSIQHILNLASPACHGQSDTFAQNAECYVAKFYLKLLRITLSKGLNRLQLLPLKDIVIRCYKLWMYVSSLSFIFLRWQCQEIPSFQIDALSDIIPRYGGRPVTIFTTGT